MEKLHLDRQTIDGTQFTISQLAQICPAAITEVADPNTGTVSRKVNFEVLRSMLGDLVVENQHEVYDFTWVGKRAAAAEAAQPIDKTLRPCVNESVDWDTTQNLYIEGDNLQVLKLLQNSYNTNHNGIKMIYIDPPYNTGKDFVYHDDFSQSREDYDEAAGNRDELGNRFYVNNDSNGRFHSDWCSMMYSRLLVCRNMLADDGVIFISIGEQEIDNLKKISDEVFGEENFIAIFIWEKTQHFGRQKLNSYSNNDYVLCYGKQIGKIEDGKLKLKELLVETVKTELQDAPLFNASNNINTLTFPPLSTKFNMRDGIYNQSNSADYELLDSVTVKNGRNLNEFRLRFRSRWSNQTVQDEIKKRTTFWVKTESFAIRAIYGGNRASTDAPRQIIFTNSSNPMATKDRFDKRVDTSENATNHLVALMGGEYFSYPKPVSLIKYLCSILYSDKNKDFVKEGVFLDFFSGSATTAHAVMQLNAEDGGNRRFIMVQLPEPTPEDSEARRAGYENICEIGKERIRRAGKKIKAEHPDANIDTGFRVLKLSDSNFKQVSFAPKDYNQTMLTALIDNIQDGRTDLDLLFDCLLRWGIELSMPIARIETDHCHILNVNDGDLVACLDRDATITESVIDSIAKMHPVRIALLDTAFSEASHKMNIFEQFKQRLGWDDETASKSIRVI